MAAQSLQHFASVQKCWSVSYNVSVVIYINCTLCDVWHCTVWKYVHSVAISSVALRSVQWKMWQIYWAAMGNVASVHVWRMFSGQCKMWQGTVWQCALRQWAGQSDWRERGRCTPDTKARRHNLCFKAARHNLCRTQWLWLLLSTQYVLKHMHAYDASNSMLKLWFGCTACSIVWLKLKSQGRTNCCG